MRVAAKLAQERLTTADPAKVLGLSGDMVRLLATDGRLQTAAETVRGLRLLRKEDVDTLTADRAGHPVHQHIVQFYAGEDFIVRILSEFLAERMRSHSPVLVIATKQCAGAVLELLASEERELDVRRAIESGQLAIFDASEKLETFLVQGSPDAKLFRHDVGEPVESRSDCRAPLQELWNDLARGCRVSQLCGYSIGTFQTSGHAPAFERIVSYTRGSRRLNSASMIATPKRACVASPSSRNVRTRSRAKWSCGSAWKPNIEAKTTLRVGGVDGPARHVMGAIR
jgi:hypothetical protein